MAKIYTFTSTTQFSQKILVCNFLTLQSILLLLYLISNIRYTLQYFKHEKKQVSEMKQFQLGICKIFQYCKSNTFICNWYYISLDLSHIVIAVLSDLYSAAAADKSEHPPEAFNKVMRCYTKMQTDELILKPQKKSLLIILKTMLQVLFHNL